MKIDITSINKILKKLKRKDPALFRAVQKKINQIALCDNISIQHYKNLRGNLRDYKRVHIGSFILTFQVQKDIVIFRRFEHHDNAY